MNIFATDDDPYVSANNLDDLRLSKMVLESAQLLSTACYLKGVRDDYLYKPTHVGHPCTQWLLESRKNVSWLLDHATSMVKIKLIATSNIHSSVVPLSVSIKYIDKFPDIDRTPFRNCTSLKSHEYDHLDVFTKYKIAMIMKWSTDLVPPKWKNRQPPDWWDGSVRN